MSMNQYESFGQINLLDEIIVDNFGDKWETKHLFCPNCGRPLTPEARSMLEKRLRGCMG